MTFTQLQVFAKVVDTRSFTKTGDLLNMTQSAVSHAVTSLEAELGVQMLIRDRKNGIMVSEFGNRVLEPVRDIWRHVGLRHLFEKETPRIVKAFVDTAQLLFRSEPLF